MARPKNGVTFLDRANNIQVDDIKKRIFLGKGT